MEPHAGKGVDNNFFLLVSCTPALRSHRVGKLVPRSPEKYEGPAGTGYHVKGPGVGLVPGVWESYLGPCLGYAYHRLNTDGTRHKQSRHYLEDTKGNESK